MECCEGTCIVRLPGVILIFKNIEISRLCCAKGGFMRIHQLLIGLLLVCCPSNFSFNKLFRGLNAVFFCARRLRYGIIGRATSCLPCLGQSSISVAVLNLETGETKRGCERYESLASCVYIRAGVGAT